MSVIVDQFVGKTLGKYQLRQLLGQGNLTAVYAAHPYGQGQPVMLTIFMLPQACTGSARERFMQRFTQEAARLLKLNHPHVVSVYDFGEQDGYPYLVTPLGEGYSLATVLKQYTRCTPAQTLELLKQIAPGLDYVHEQGMVHGSLKPSNILLDTNRHVQIAGFGLASLLEMRGIGSVKHSHPHLFNVAGTFLTSSEYVAPEVVSGSPADARADIYALGIILFEMLSGRPPFVGDDPFALALQHVERGIPSLQDVYPDGPTALDLVLQRALERDPERRVASAGKLLRLFERTMDVLQKASQSQVMVQLPNAQPTVVSWVGNEAETSAQWRGEPTFTTTRMPVPAAQTMLDVQPMAAPVEQNRRLQAPLPTATDQIILAGPMAMPYSALAPANANLRQPEPPFDPLAWSSVGPVGPPMATSGTFNASQKPQARPQNQLAKNVAVW